MLHLLLWVIKANPWHSHLRTLWPKSLHCESCYCQRCESMGVKENEAKWPLRCLLGRAWWC